MQPTDVLYGLTLGLAFIVVVAYVASWPYNFWLLAHRSNPLLVVASMVLKLVPLSVAAVGLLFGAALSGGEMPSSFGEVLLRGVISFGVLAAISPWMIVGSMALDIVLVVRSRDDARRRVESASSVVSTDNN
jgi:hypothetical protein